MAERNVSEVELRAMLERASAIERSDLEGRFIVHTKHRRRRWRVVVEPDEGVECVVVVTVYSREEP